MSELNYITEMLELKDNNIKFYKNYLPKVLSLDEFKSVKSADGTMSFHMCNGVTGQTINIVEDRKLVSLSKKKL